MIVVLSQRKCGLSRCVTSYLLAMGSTDLLLVVIDLILRQILYVFRENLTFMFFIPVCKFHAVLLYAARDCSVWFTVTFTFDRFVAISCQKLKSKYCTEKTAGVILGTVTVLSFTTNIFWYFMFSVGYQMTNSPRFCITRYEVLKSPVWAGIEFAHYLITPFIPFVLILGINALTIRHIVVSSRARRRLRAHRTGESAKDPEIQSRRKSIILLFVISGNFILLWVLYLVHVIWDQLWWMNMYLADSIGWLREIAYMLQMLSLCTNTCIYAVTQTKFRIQLKIMMKYPFSLIAKLLV